jgi:hypothetical protein
VLDKHRQLDIPEVGLGVRQTQTLDIPEVGLGVRDRVLISKRLVRCLDKL